MDANSSFRGWSCRSIIVLAALIIFAFFSDAELSSNLKSAFDLVSDSSSKNSSQAALVDDGEEELVRISAGHHKGTKHNRTRWWKPRASAVSLVVNDTVELLPPPLPQQPRIPKRSPHHVYLCGWANLWIPDRPDDSLPYALFPEVNITDLVTHGLTGLDPFQEDDVLIYPCGGDCPLRSIHTEFPGKILFIDGESVPWKCPEAMNTPVDRKYALDRILNSDPNNVNASTFVPAMYLSSLPVQVRESMFDPSKRVVNTGEHFLIYANSNCVGYREEAFRQVAKIGPPVHYGGYCQGGGGVGERSAEVAAGSWGVNAVLFRKYRFVLCLENTVAEGYITEKIMHPFFSGSIPIYYGTKEIFDVFNAKAFIWYDIENPKVALDQIAYLESNKTAYMEMFSEPILAHGEETIAKYFSLRDSDGGGRLKWAIRDKIGFD